MRDLSDWKPCARPGLVSLEGQYASLEPLNWQRHGAGLFEAICGPGNEDIWAYLPVECPDDLNGLRPLLDPRSEWETMIIRSVDADEILGMASYMRINEAHGSVEVGCVAFGKELQRSRTATDAMYLMARHAFTDLGYRRYEWKCNEENEASKRAALRYGFRYEGLFRHHMVVKGQNRDTAWYAMLDSEWPQLDAAFQAWLNPDNFDKEGRQVRKLADLRKP